MNSLYALLLLATMRPTRAPSTPGSDASIDKQIRAELRLLRRVHDRLETRDDNYYLDFTLLHDGAAVYSVGVGRDIGFDKAILNACRGCHVHAFDNTPVANKFVARMLPTWQRTHPKTAARWHLHPYLLGATDGNVTLVLPKGFRHSYVQAEDTQGWDRWSKPSKSGNWTAEAKTIRSLMGLLNHTRLDVLKIDIEGSEFPWLTGLVQDYWLPRKSHANIDRSVCSPLPVCQLLFEFHPSMVPGGLATKAEAITQLNVLGFTPLHDLTNNGAPNILFVNPRCCLKFVPSSFAR